MKRVICSVVLMAFAGAVASALLAEEPPKTGQPVVKAGERPATSRPAVEPRREGDRPLVEPRREGEGAAAAPRLPDQVARMDKIVVFTDEQKQKIVELGKVREAAIKELNAKYQADVAALMTPEQKAKLEAAPKEGERPQVGEPRGEGNRLQVGEPRGEGNRPQVGEPRGEGNRLQVGEPRGEGNRPQVGERHVEGDRPGEGANEGPKPRVEGERR